MPLDMPKRFGNWELTAGVHALLLGDVPETINGGEDTEFIATLGFSFSF